MKLSILICTVPGRVDRFLPKILKQLESQENKDVEIIYLGDNKKRPIGSKRNDLVSIARGDYVVFVDDDDRVSPDYVSQILNATRSDADIIVFDVECKIGNGKPRLVRYDANYLHDADFKDRYERLPNHIMCIKKSIAKKIPFQNTSFGEDADFAERLKKSGLVKTQLRISKTLYYYDFSHQTSEAQ